MAVLWEWWRSRPDALRWTHILLALGGALIGLTFFFGLVPVAILAFYLHPIGLAVFGTLSALIAAGYFWITTIILVLQRRFIEQGGPWSEIVSTHRRLQSCNAGRLLTGRKIQAHFLGNRRCHTRCPGKWQRVKGLDCAPGTGFPELCLSASLENSPSNPRPALYAPRPWAISAALLSKRQS